MNDNEIFIIMLFVVIIFLIAFLYTLQPNYVHVRNKCSPRTLKLLHNQLNNFKKCKICKNDGMCWSEPQQQCIPCGQLTETCEQLYGCNNNPPHINDKCQLCWLNN